MKKATLGLITSFAFSTLIYAGPEPYSGKDMKQVAPMPPPCPTWTGFYVGGFAGYKFAATDLDLDLGGFWDGPGARDVIDRDSIQSHTPDNLDTSGFEAGGLVGYNYQWNNWVFGLEASAGYLWLDNSHDTGIFAGPGSPNTYNVETSFESNYLMTVAPRIGYAFCRWLPYVTGGLAIGQIDFHQTITQHNFDFVEGSSEDEVHVGWMAGGGLEYAINDHWRVRGQYQFIDLGEAEFDTAGVSIFPGGPGYTGHHEAELREHNASFAIIYGF